MITINTISDIKFSFNGVNYLKNFTPIVVGDKIRILNTYDSKIELTDAPTLFSDFTLDGLTYANVALLQDALLLVIFTRSTLSGGGGGATTFLDLTDTPSAYTGQANKIVSVNAGETALEFSDPVNISEIKHVPVSQSTSSTTGVVANFLSYTLEADSKYLIRGSFRVEPTTNGGAKVRFSAGINTSFLITVQSRLNNSTTFVGLPLSNNGVLSSAFNTVVSSFYNHTFQGVITTGVDTDTLDFIFATVTGAMTLLPDTSFELIKIV